MSTRESPHREPAHCPADATRWFNRWHVYRAIVDADWMGHRRIFNAIRAWVLLRHPGPFALLDLGCGDAGFIEPTFDETGLWFYTGVDASVAALAKAGDELAGARFQTRLLEADMLAFLRQERAPGAENFDVILASYAVHHLPTLDKREFFRLAHGKLASGGTLLFADVFTRDGESRDEYLDRYVGMMRQSWTGMPPEALASTIEHVTHRDFPESAGRVCEMAREAGFHLAPQELFWDGTGFHRLLAFTRIAAS